MIPLFKVFMAEEAIANSSQVLQSGYIGQGVVVEEFEEALAHYMDNRYCITTNSATSALHLALRLINVAGKEVISTPLTMAASNLTIVLNGGKIVWADTDEYGNIDPEDVATKITDKTAAIMAVHWGGVPCDVRALNELGVPVIEDAAHAFGASRYGERIGTISPYTVFSFQAIKLVTSIDGGALFVKDSKTYEKGRLLRWYGIDRVKMKETRDEGNIHYLGDKLHMNDVCASVGLSNLKYAELNLAITRGNAAYYQRALADVVTTPPNIGNPSWWLYQIQVDDREGFIRYMTENGVHVSIVNNRNDEHTCMVNRFDLPMLPVLDSIDTKRVCIPVGWWVSHEDRAYIADLIKKGW